MINIPTKVDGESTLPASEFNSLVNELKNLITSSGQSLDGGSTNQIARAVANYVASGDFYTDGGSADTYSLTIAGNKRSPTSLQDGLRARFRAGNSNTGASTINVASLGAKDLKKADGSEDLEAGDIVTGNLVEVYYNSSQDVFILSSITLQDFLRADEPANLGVGYTTTAFDIGNSGNLQVEPAIENSAIQTLFINGSFELTAPTDTESGYIEIEATNDATGGYSVTITDYDTISGTYDSSPNAVNLFRISKINSNNYLEIAQPEV
jgi:hypothetical protein